MAVEALLLGQLEQACYQILFNREAAVETLNFIQEAYSEDTGGGFVCDVLVLKDGTVLVIGEESIVLYPEIEAWEGIDGNRQSGVIFRAVASTNGSV